MRYTTSIPFPDAVHLPGAETVCVCVGGGVSEYPPPSRMRNSQTFYCACVKRGRHSKFEDFQDGH